MSRRSAYQLISAATVVENVPNCAQTLPLSEAQARPLTALPPEQQREAWAKVLSTAPSGKVTAVHVAQVVRGYQRESVPAAPKRKNFQNLQMQSTKTLHNQLQSIGHKLSL